MKKTTPRRFTLVTHIRNFADAANRGKKATYYAGKLKRPVKTSVSS